MTRRTRYKALLWAAGLVPLAVLGVRVLQGEAGANPVETMTHVTGEWGLRFLLLTLAVTPARRWLGWRRLGPYRRELGLLAFTYACSHLLVWALFDHQFDPAAIAADVIERPFVTAGMAAFLLLLPLAVTSTKGWVRRLGRTWIKLHRLVYVATVAAVVHFWWLVKADVLEPAVYAGVVALLLGLRIASRYAKPAGRR